MRQPTLLLFSLVIGTTILVFTAERLDQLMGSERALVRDASPTVAEHFYSYVDQLQLYSTVTLKKMRRAWRSLQGEPPEATVIITEDTVETIWVWTEASGVQRFSRGAPPSNVQARPILYPKGMPLPDEQDIASSDPEPNLDALTNNSQSSPQDHLLELLVDENGESRFKEGLRNFRHRYEEADKPSPQALNSE